jgi:endonuclease YncB( thermonuclease family)
MRQLLIVALAGCVAVAAVSAAERVTLAGKVVAISDGDTLTLLDASKVQHRIRLDGIDAPEAKQAFGNRSRQSLGELAHEREAVAECSKIDKYKRPVCVVRVNGLDMGLEQIKRGMAWHFRRYAHEQTPENRAAYATAEAEARAEKRGLWRDARPVPPWEWRSVRAANKENPSP